MRKIIFIVISFALCALGNLSQEWLYFSPFFLLFSLPNINSSLMWEIPAGCIVTDILFFIGKDYDSIIFRLLIVIAASLIPISSLKKLLVFFPLAACLLFSNAGDRLCGFIMAGIIISTADEIIRNKSMSKNKILKKSF